MDFSKWTERKIPFELRSRELTIKYSIAEMSVRNDDRGQWTLYFAELY